LYLEKETYCFVSYQRPIELNSKINQVNTILIKKYGFDITSVMLTNQVTLDELPIKLQCLRKKLKVLFLRMRGSMLLDCEMIQHKNIGTLPDTTALKQALQQSNFALYEKAYTTIFETLNGQENYEHFKTVAFTLALLVQTYQGKQLDLFYPGGSVAWFNEVLACEEYSQLNELFLIVGGILMDKAKLCSKEVQQELVERMKEYITDTMQDKNLTTAMVAEKFNLPINFVRVQFKHYTGTTIYKTISSTRLDSSLKLLEETDLALNEIRKRVGFCNFTHFYSYFKKEKGMSPLLYRSLYRKASNQ
jgi:YesN/AraC family two-component response regulator